MARYKMKKASHIIDMTAFSGVAFILLTFMMIGGRPKMLGGFINMPVFYSWKLCGMNDPGTITIFLKGEKTFIGFDDDSLKLKTLKLMCRKYSVVITSGEAELFNKSDVFGAPINQLKGFLADGGSLKEALQGEGIPSDKILGNQLADWIAFSQRANNEIKGFDPRVEIVADKDVPYPYIRNILNNVQHYGIKKFALLNYAGRNRTE